MTGPGRNWPLRSRFPQPPPHQTIHLATGTAYYMPSAARTGGRCELLTQFVLVSKFFEKMIEEKDFCCSGSYVPGRDFGLQVVPDTYMSKKTH